MYSDIFCKVYNEFGWNYYPEAFGEQLLQWMQLLSFHPKTAMDLACGTGILCNILSTCCLEVICGIIKELWVVCMVWCIHIDCSRKTSHNS